MLHPLVHKTAAAMMFQMGGGGFTITTIKTMMFQMGGGGFTMTTMQSFSLFLIVRRDNQMAMNLQLWPQMITMPGEERTIVINDEDDNDIDDDVNKEL